MKTKFKVGDWVKCSCGCRQIGPIYKITDRFVCQHAFKIGEWFEDKYDRDSCLEPYNPSNADKLSYITWLTRRATA